MVPPELKDFLIATVTASTSFIGLLFVAISFAIDAEKTTKAELKTKRILAESSNAALLSVFFISLVGLIPGTNISYVMFVMAWAGLSNVGHFFAIGDNEDRTKSNLAVLSFSALVYICQGAYAVSIFLHKHNQYTSKYGLMTLMIFLFSIALGRAWELTGIRSQD